MKKDKNVIVITGASSGFGALAARALALGWSGTVARSSVSSWQGHHRRFTAGRRPGRESSPTRPILPPYDRRWRPSAARIRCSPIALIGLVRNIIARLTAEN